MQPTAPHIPAATALLGAAAVLSLPSAALAEGFLDTRYQYYQEDNDRVRVDSNYTLFGWDAGAAKVEGSFLYSLIAGASPTGLPSNGGELPTIYFEDERYAGTLDATLPFEAHALKAGVSYSYEPDYESVGFSVQETLFLNEKMTELVAGLGYSADTVGAAGTSLSEDKEAWTGLFGVNQIINEKTLLRLNASVAHKSGFLSDPYKRVLFEDVEEGGVFNEKRPDSRTDVLLLAEISHYLEALESNLEIGARYGHSDHGVTSTTLTASLTREFLDGKLQLKPSLRYYQQSAADYYAVSFRGDPEYYSSDYRLSELSTLTLGIQAHWTLVPDKLSLNLGYEHYLMEGQDGKTEQAAYSDAMAITMGLKLKF